jgi:Fe-S oxidoreductase
MVTREEKHSTRGRARMLNEMIRGEVVHGGWKSEEVKEALDLCLSCKGCKADCPVQVDMATYKAEFLSHYYEGRLRPRHAYASGFIFWWARMASAAPSLANFFTQTPPFNSLAKSIAGYAQQRQIPKFAKETFKHWFFQRRLRNKEGQKVLLWADTFNNYFTPGVAKAAVEVLEAAGYHVEVRQEHICCGRPLYDFGLLERARKTLEKTLAVLEPAIQNGTPVIGLEPSCVSVFRDELPNILAGNENAKRLSAQVVTLAEFLSSQDKYSPPHVSGKAIVHGHCHHKSILKFDSEASMLRKTGLDCRILDSGCCGMAGAFGYEKEHYEVSVQCGERVLLPAVRAAAPDDIVIADGFSCREQILQQTGRPALHFSEVLRKGIL